MNVKNLRTILFTLLISSVIFLASCEKQKITFKNTPAPGSTVLPELCENCHNGTFAEHSSNAHAKHTKGLYAYSCNTCHFGHGYETATHMNGVKNVTFNLTSLITRNGNDSNSPTWDSKNKTCSNVYCHSNGRTAYRGQDPGYPNAVGSMNWSATVGKQIAVYATTPRWDNGKVTECTSCHNGLGNMTSPFLVSKPNSMKQSNYPESGQHQLLFHMTNNKDFSASPYTTPQWDGVQCFWCHNTSTVAAANDSVNIINNSNLQGTYGTNYHVDGQTFFKPLSISAGGTMANGSRYSGNGNAAHCGVGKKCW